MRKCLRKKLRKGNSAGARTGLIPADTYEALPDSIEDYHLGRIVTARQNEKNAAVEVDIDEL